MISKSKRWVVMSVAASFFLVGLVPTQAGMISAGYNDSFGVQADGSLWAWGYNGNRQTISAHEDSYIMQEANQLGLNIARGIYMDALWTGYSTSTPTRVGSSSAWIGIYSPPWGANPFTGFVVFGRGEGNHTFGLQRDGSLWAWGYDGDPSVVATTNSPSAMYVGKGTLGLGDRIVSETITYTNASTNILTNIAYYAASVGVPTRVGTDTDWADLAPGSEHTLALKRNGSLWSWGYDGIGILPNPLMLTPIALASIRRVSWAWVWIWWSQPGREQMGSVRPMNS